jgi:hypothetical protein
MALSATAGLYGKARDGGVDRSTAVLLVVYGAPYGRQFRHDSVHERRGMDALSD